MPLFRGEQPIHIRVELRPPGELNGEPLAFRNFPMLWDSEYVPRCEALAAELTRQFDEVKLDAKPDIHIGFLEKGDYRPYVVFTNETDDLHQSQIFDWVDHYLFLLLVPHMVVNLMHGDKSLDRHSYQMVAREYRPYKILALVNELNWKLLPLGAQVHQFVDSDTSDEWLTDRIVIQVFGWHLPGWRKHIWPIIDKIVVNQLAVAD